MTILTKVHVCGVLVGISTNTIMVRLRLLPTGGDNDLEEDKVVLAASLMSEFPLNIGVIIADEKHGRATKFTTSLLFPCLIAGSAKRLMYQY
ncbi:hypothetical protein HAX54_034559 [Datura stramonium]|uniref:Uncharacterized protein n=1 Tax=Datura stramonium TaxID=4076 RepID=A0ABS8SEE5_DATST|nr:hypothetical protein [Datura stramonium]